MTLTLDSDLEKLVREAAQNEGITPEKWVENILREKYAPKQREAINGIVPRDDWEENLLKIGTDCGVSLPNEAVSSEGIYD